MTAAALAPAPAPFEFSDDLGSPRYAIEGVDLAGNSWEEGRYLFLPFALLGAALIAAVYELKGQDVLVRVVDLEQDGAPVVHEDEAEADVFDDPLQEITDRTFDCGCRMTERDAVVCDAHSGEDEEYDS